MTAVAIHQPQYLPWMPYFAKSAKADLFIYLDTVQFQKNGFQNRNQIKTSSGPQWLTVPINTSLQKTIREVRIANQHWKKKHICTIQQSYSNAPFLNLFNKGLKPILEKNETSLCELNIAITEWFFDYFDIKCRRVRSSEMEVSGKKEELIINLCKEAGAAVYVSGQGAMQYQDEEKFLQNGIKVIYCDYKHEVYPQQHNAALGFVPKLSALDLILNTDRDVCRSLLTGASSKAA